MPTLAEELLEEIDTALEEIEVSIQFLQYDLSEIRPPEYLPEEFFAQIGHQLQTTEGTLQLACTFNDIGGYAKDIATVTGLLSSGPPGIILAAIKVTNQTLGILVGLYQNSQRWGVEINKSPCNQLRDGQTQLRIVAGPGMLDNLPVKTKTWVYPAARYSALVSPGDIDRRNRARLRVRTWCSSFEVREDYINCITQSHITRKKK